MLNKEPAVILGSLSEVVRAIIPTLIIFGYIQWTGDQVAQVMLLISVIVGFFNAALTRSQVVPTVKANSQIETAITMPATATVNDVIKEEAKKENA
jgi:hypothetical protein